MLGGAMQFPTGGAGLILPGHRVVQAGLGTVVSPYLLRDTFTDANGTALGSHTMDVGSGWTVHLGAWEIQSNAVVATALTGGGEPNSNEASADAGDADVTVSASVAIPNTASYAGGLLVRVSDGQNHWRVRVQRDSGTPRSTLIERVAGADTVRSSANDATLVNRTVVLSAVLSGATITVFVDGVQTDFYGSATGFQTSTRHGVECYRGSGYSQMPTDDFEVTA